MTQETPIEPAVRHAKLRSGEEYLRALRDGRRVYADGERVKDIAAHPAFRGAARSMARLFDVAAAPENRDLMTYASPKTGAPVWRAWQIPTQPCGPAGQAAGCRGMGRDALSA